VVASGADASAPAGGTRLWVERYRSGTAEAIAASPDGTKVFVMGGSARGSTLEDYATVAYDQSSGAQLWVRRYDGPDGGEDFASSVAVSPDGTKVAVTGASAMPDFRSPSYATSTYDAVTGGTLWGRRYHGRGNGGTAFALTFAADGSRLFVTGGSGSRGGTADYTTIAYAA
jgi:hypothetical protein